MRSAADIAATLATLRAVRSTGGVRLISDNGLLPYLQAYNDRDKSQPAGSPAAAGAIAPVTATAAIRALIVAYAGYARALKWQGVSAIDTHGGAGALPFRPDEAAAAAVAYGSTESDIDQAATRYKAAPGTDLPVLSDVAITAVAPVQVMIPTPSEIVSSPAIIAPAIAAVQTAMIVPPPGGDDVSAGSGGAGSSAMIVTAVPVQDLPQTTIYTQAVDADAAAAANAAAPAPSTTNWKAYIWWGVGLAIVAYLVRRWWK